MEHTRKMDQARMAVISKAFDLTATDLADDLGVTGEAVAGWYSDPQKRPSRLQEKHLFELYRLALGVGTLPEGTWGERENEQVDMALQDATGPGRVLRRIGGIVRDMGIGMLPAVQARAAAILEGAKPPGFPEATVVLGRARSFGLTQVQNRMQMTVLLELQPGQEDDSPFVWFVEACPFCGGSHALFAGPSLRQVREDDHESFKEMPCGQGLVRIVESVPGVSEAPLAPPDELATEGFDGSQMPDLGAPIPPPPTEDGDE